MKVLFARLMMVLVAAGVFISCSVSSKMEPVETTTLSIDSLSANYFEDYLRLYPLEATAYGDHRFDDQLPNALTASFRNQEKEFYSSYKEQLESLLYDSLSENEKMTYDVLMWQCETELEGLQFRSYLTPVDQFSSLNLYIGDLGSGSAAQPFKTVEDYDNWLSRLEKYLEWCDTAIVNMKTGIREKYVLPQALVVRAIPQWKDFAKGPVENHLFYTPIKNIPAEFSEAEKSRLADAYKSIINDKIIPVYQKMADFLEREYLPAARTTSGISSVPEGKAYYDHLIKVNTTTDLTADSIFRLGESEVARILKETEDIKTQLNFKGDLKAFFGNLRSRKELTPFTAPEQVIENFNAIHERMKPNVDKLFRNKPKTPFEVRRTPAFREAAASAEYFTGSEDGTRPGIFYVPIPDVREYNVMRDEDLFLHEAIPGHHYQLSLQMENTSLPKIRRMLTFSAYAEGWALYTESLGKELGLYTDPYQYLGMLGGDMHRAIRLVVDVGMHSKGWTREQAIQYSKDHESMPEQGIVAEIERYMAIPGQALSYKIGQLTIRQLRTKAEKALEADFDVADFHDQVLNAGNLPLKVLEKKIDRWIQSRKAGKTSE